MSAARLAANFLVPQGNFLVFFQPREEICIKMEYFLHRHLDKQSPWTICSASQRWPVMPFVPPYRSHSVCELAEKEK